eukprot:TRINITY_DN3151_c0_g1_i2.p1 TRINITY_DN3151_c0_g1~~TRINITY_DN3151_c0_g1_i2.p1  ORF type:complete len:600 (-),score=239.46 TRINITY_DN3151_c0_g1_i2:313-2028(-)
MAGTHEIGAGSAVNEAEPPTMAPTAPSGVAPPPPVTAADRERVVIVVSGKDHPGITSAIMSAVARAGVDILDVRQTSVRRRLTLAVELEVGMDARSQSVFRELLLAAKKVGTKIDFDIPESGRTLPAVSPSSAAEAAAASEPLVRRLSPGVPATNYVLTLLSAEAVPPRFLQSLGELLEARGFSTDKITRLSRRQLRSLELSISQAPGGGRQSGALAEIRAAEADGTGWRTFGAPAGDSAADPAASGDGAAGGGGGGDDLDASAWALDDPDAVGTKEVDVGDSVHGFNGQAMADFRSALYTFGKSQGVDVALQAESVLRRSKRLVVMDMDSTLIQQEVIDELARHAGVYEAVRDITHAAMGGGLDFNESLRQRVALLAGTPATAFRHVIDNLVYTDGAHELCRSLKKLGYRLAVISGGFTAITEHVRKELGLNYDYANQLEVGADGCFTGRTVGPIVNAQRKADLLMTIAQQERISLNQVIAIGDGANDLPMLAVAGLGIAFNAKPAVQEAATFRINQRSLESVLYLLGFSEDDQQELSGRPQQAPPRASPPVPTVERAGVAANGRGAASA